MPEAEAQPEVSIIIVSYNTRAMTLDCLRAVMADPEGRRAEIFVVDNASSDGSVEAIREEFPSVQVLASKTNLGFGAANNRAMKEARGRYFLLLNSDAFPKPGAIAALVAAISVQPRVGIIGPKLLNKDGTLQVSCFKFPSPFCAWVENLWLSAAFSRHPTIGDYRKWPHDAPREVDWIVGACMLLRREIVEQVGGFDEKFFMYAEESDWQRRIGKVGWAIAFTPAAEVVHLGGASGVTQRARINRAFFESLDYYELKHHGRLGLLSLRLAMILGCFMRFWLWLAAGIVSPRRRATAGSKLKLHGWLMGRQIGNWSVLFQRKGII